MSRTMEPLNLTASVLRNKDILMFVETQQIIIDYQLPNSRLEVRL